ncbi:MAG: prolipoprotein diacylglyceryl transferase [Candidatus Promineifilaceae bacterium]
MLDFLQIDPVAFTIPIGDGFPVYWYGIIITVGIVLGSWWAGREIEKRGQSVDDLYNGLLLVVLFGYLFARLWYVFQDAVIAGNSAAYTSFLDVINIRAGGANILGGFVGAALVGFLYVKWRKLSFWDYADVAGPTLLLAQAVGRWGNFINQELYGPPTELPWGILIDNRIPPYNDLALYPPDTRFHPTFLYESLWLLAGFFLLTYLNRRFRDQWRKGTLFGAFLIWWGGGRAWVEFFRPDQPTIGSSPITYSMLLALALAVAGVLLILRRYDKLGGSIRRRQRVRKPKPRRQQPG